MNEVHKSKLNLGNSLKSFDPGLVNHFPKINSFSLAGYHFAFPKPSLNTHLGASLIARYNITERVDSIFSNYSKNSIRSCFHEDSCNLILPIVHYSNHTIENPILEPCDFNYLPIPNFKRILSDIELDSLNYLPDDFILYVLDAKPGMFLENGLLFKDKVMPVGWEHGYTKGVAISSIRNIAIFWLVLW